MIVFNRIAVTFGGPPHINEAMLSRDTASIASKLASDAYSKVISSIEELGTISLTDVALMPDQITDFAHGRAYLASQKILNKFVETQGVDC